MAWIINGEDVDAKIHALTADLTSSSDSGMPDELLASRNVLETKYVALMNDVMQISESTSLEDLKDMYREAKSSELFYDSTQLTAKINANALYGYLGAKFAKLYNKAVAADITADGRNLLKMVDKYTTMYFVKNWQNETEFFDYLKKKYPVIKADAPKSLRYTDEFPLAVYGDTDSLYFNFEKVVDSLDITLEGNTKDITMIIQEIVEGPLMKMIDKLMDNYITNRNGDNYYIFELETILRRGIFLAKKKYVGSYLMSDGLYVAKDMKLKTTGIELNQNNTPFVIRQDIKKVVYYLLASTRADDEVFFNLFALLVKKYKDVDLETWIKSRWLGKFDKYTKVDRQGYYRPLKGADKVTKGAIKYNNMIIKNKLQREYPLVKEGDKVKYYTTEDGEMFSYPSSDEARFPAHIAPEINVRATLKGLLFDPVKRVMAMTTGKDMSLVGSNVYAKNISLFSKNK